MSEVKKVPEIRFEGFAEPWEQRKFSDVVQIERGGSPRPIDDYITDSQDGLNWVKIGDAPAQGHYITKTAEKIKPEGLCLQAGAGTKQRVGGKGVSDHFRQGEQALL